MTPLRRYNVAIPEYLHDEIRRVSAGSPLTFPLVMTLLTVSPVADRFDDNPVGAMTMSRRVDSGALHLSPYHLVVEACGQQRTVISVVNKLLTGQNWAEMYCTPVPFEFCGTATVEQSG